MSIESDAHMHTEFYWESKTHYNVHDCYSVELDDKAWNQLIQKPKQAKQVEWNEENAKTNE